MGLDALGRFGAELSAGQLEVVVGLEIQPELRAVAEVQAEARRGVGADPATGSCRRPSTDLSADRCRRRA
jgi:hypothetical protein